MFTTDFFRYLKGTVRFQAYGGYFERLLNQAAEQGIFLRKVKKEGPCFYGTTTPKDYKRLARIASQNGIRLRTERKKGFPFLLHRYRKRIGILIGVGVFALFLLFMQNFVWQIEVVGNTAIKTEQIESLARELGLKKGAFLHTLNFKAVQKELEYQLPDIAWLTVNNKGSKIVIELAEMTKSPDMSATDEPSNLVAKKDGVIRYMEIYSGEKTVKVRDVVSKGDLLVSGILEDEFQQTTFVPSRGMVIAETFEEKTFSQPLKEKQKLPTGAVKKRNYLDVFGLKIPLFLAFRIEGNFEKSQQSNQLSLFGMQLPLGIDQLIFEEYTEKEVVYTPKEAEELLLRRISDFEKNDRKDAKIISREMEKKEEGGALTIKVSYIFEEDIAREEKILIGE